METKFVTMNKLYQCCWALVLLAFFFGWEIPTLVLTHLHHQSQFVAHVVIAEHVNTS